ncbi:zinc ABC transporter substrate-binding protein [Streptomyces sp. ISL-111]|uniref:metal ABC transporter solute-binding protein, Zn/Mn family n=1 Tax=Streptomyces sp. ISL-111 TaxID=2819175 RepID=UPI001BE8513C|nr:zinc ABC transporter substrate-binding protein [Streptomyces sp. ISL-111]
MPPVRSLALVVAGVLTSVCAGVGMAGSGAAAASAPDTEAIPVPVVASANVYGNIAEQIGGDKVDVVSIISDPAQDPHSYEASTQDRLAVSKAKVVIENGGGYDEFVDRMLRTTKNDSPEVVNAVDVSGKTAVDGGELNEHLWYDLPSMGRVADRTADALAEAAPADAGTFRENARGFKDKLSMIEAKEARIKADHGGATVAVTEPLPLYMIEASGLVNKTPDAFSEAIEEGGDVSPRALRQTLDLFTDDQVAALVYNAQTTGPETEKIEQTARDNAIPVVPMSETLPAGEDYVSWMTSNVNALGSALDS